METNGASDEEQPPGYERVEQELLRETFELDEVTAFFQTMANSTRLTILYILIEDGPVESADLADAVDREQNYLYHHLNELEEADLVRKRRQNGTSVYELSPDGGQSVPRLLDAIDDYAARIE
ncbi:hypothetical protein JCM30237_23690 [Halolamina litorea]|uniref:ArsR/SmtB family transcription factor n=1 Tax=Halolamina litorea TaxID=1515593 RepID=A0ABD6BTT3_9EURY|nr:winged helix-turn-helix domain-containing protein [Halolamina litorea]